MKKLILIFLIIATSAYSTIAPVGSTVYSRVTSGGILSITTGSLTTGNLLIISVSNYDANNNNAWLLSGIAKTGGTATIGTLSMDKSQGINNTDVAIFSTSIKSSGTVTFTLTSTQVTDPIVAGIQEFSGLDTSSFRVYSSALGSSTSTYPPTTSSINSNNAGLFYGVAAFDLSGTINSTPGTGFTELWKETDDNVYQPAEAEYSIVTSTTTKAIAWLSPTSAVQWNAVGVVYISSSSSTLATQYSLSTSGIRCTVTPTSGNVDSGAVVSIISTPVAAWDSAGTTVWSYTGGAHITSLTSSSTTAYLTSNGTITATYYLRNPRIPIQTYPTQSCTTSSNNVNFTFNNSIDSAIILTLFSDSGTTTLSKDTSLGYSISKTLSATTKYFYSLKGLTGSTWSASSGIISFRTGGLGSRDSIKSCSVFKKDSSVIIKGFNFKSKSPVAPIVWANFNSSINPSGQKSTWDEIQNMTRSTIPSGSGYTYGLKGTWNNGLRAFNVMISKSPSYWTKLYLYLKRYYDFDATGNQKFFRLWNAGTTGPNDFVSIYAGTDGAKCYNEYEASTGGISGNIGGYQGTSYIKNNWLQEEFTWCFNGGSGKNTDNSQSTSFGIYDYTRNGVMNQHRENVDNSTNTQQELRIDNFTDADYLPVGDSDVYMTDIYVDDNYSRVMIGNAPTLTTSTHREIQVPTAWTDTSITITTNTGTFNVGDTVYIFVQNSDDSISKGFKVRIANASQTGSDPTSLFTFTINPDADSVRILTVYSDSGSTVYLRDTTTSLSVQVSLLTNTKFWYTWKGQTPGNSWSTESALVGFLTGSGLITPSIVSIIPDSGSVQGNKKVAINGSNFGTSTVKIGTQSQTMTSVSTTIDTITTTSQNRGLYKVYLTDNFTNVDSSKSYYYYKTNVNYTPSTYTETQNVVSPGYIASTTTDPWDSIGFKTALPTGLSLNHSTGSITGTPTVLQGATNYVMYAYKYGYKNDSTTLNITVTSPGITQFTLTMAANSGTTNPSIGTSQVDSFSIVSISHTPGSGYGFKKWTRSNSLATFGDSSIISTTIRLKSNTTITAVDTLNPVFCVLTINSSTGGNVSISKDSVVCGINTSVTATANIGYRFLNWTRSSTTVIISDSTNPSITVHKNDLTNGTITANFSRVQYTLTINNTNQSSNLSTGLVDSGTVYSLTATPNQHFYFDKWTRNNTNVIFGDSSLNSTTIYLKANGTITGSSLQYDSIISVYPKASRIDSKSTVAQRTITVKVHGNNKPTTNTIINYGSISLNKNASYTDSTVTDTLFKFPVLLNGLFRVFLTDNSWKFFSSDTLLNASQLLNPGAVIINPK